MKLGNWTWLEATKIFVSVLAPMLIAMIGIYIHRITKKFEQTQWRNQKLIEKRIAVYDNLAPLLNDVLCYFTYVGNWKEKTPPQMISAKREIDRQIYLAAPLFSEDFFEVCISFQKMCYRTFCGWGEDARLNTNFQRRKEHSIEKWNDEWDKLFSVPNAVATPNEIQQAYKSLMTVFAKDLGVASNLSIKTGMFPGNIK